MIINVYFFETVHLFIECFFRKMFIQFVNIIIDVVHRQRRYGDAARARRRESWSNKVRKMEASPRKHTSSDGD